MKSGSVSGKYGNVADSFGMLWRFAPMSDPFVDEFHSRDLGELNSDLRSPTESIKLIQFLIISDSVISAREAAGRKISGFHSVSVLDPVKPLFVLSSAVKDFRDATERTLHVMRDNPNHGAIVLGGMFGARMPSLGSEDPRKVCVTIQSFAHA